MSYNFGLTAFKTNKENVVEFLTKNLVNYAGSINDSTAKEEVGVIEMKNGWSFITPDCFPRIAVDGAKQMSVESICYATYEIVGSKMVSYIDSKGELILSAIDYDGATEFINVDKGELLKYAKEDDSWYKRSDWESSFEYELIYAIRKYKLPFDIEDFATQSMWERNDVKNNKLVVADGKYLNSFSSLPSVNWGKLCGFGKRGATLNFTKMLELYS